MKRNTMFFVIAITTMFTTSCRKPLLAQQPAGFNQQTRYVEQPKLLGWSQDYTVAYISYNGAPPISLPMTMGASTGASNPNSEGFLAQPVTQPSQWTYSDGGALIADGSTFNTGMSYDIATVWYAVLNVDGRGVPSVDFKFTTMSWDSKPNCAGDYRAYDPGTFNLKVGWYQPVKIKSTINGLFIMNK